MDYITEKYPELLTLLEKRLGLAEKYLKLTENQASCIAADDEVALFASLEERDALAKEIDNTNKEAEEPLREYNAFSKKDADISKAEYLLERTRALYVQCLTLDRKNMGEIKARMKKATGDSKELQKRREGINKYAQTDYIFAPSVLDEQK